MTSGTEKRVRSGHLTVRLSGDERAAVKAAADRAGLTEGSYARQQMLGAPPPRQVRRPPVDRRELARLLAETGKIGSNLNQLTKAVHTGVLVYEGELDAVLAGLLEIRAAVLRALGREP
ncbi:MAG TPA: plasmid mobilization relaxosome protein MobC [Polyangiaceae bacterium]